MAEIGYMGWHELFLGNPKELTDQKVSRDSRKLISLKTLSNSSSLMGADGFSFLFESISLVN